MQHKQAVALPSRARLFLSLLVLACSIFSLPGSLSAHPNIFSPTSGPVCTEVALTGDIPSPPFQELNVTFNNVEAAGVKVATYKDTTVFPPRTERAIIAAVPAEASTGPLVVRFSQIFRPIKTLTFSKPFIVTGGGYRQPVITSFSATPNEIYSASEGSTLRWSIEGPTTSVVLNGENQGYFFLGENILSPRPNVCILQKRQCTR